MTKTTWVRNIRYNIKGQDGCCGAASVFRLNAGEISESSRDTAIRQWHRHPNAKMALVGYYNWKKDTLYANMKRLERMPVTKPTRYGEDTNYWKGGAVPLHWAFVATLEAMEYNKQAMYLMTDNVAGEGDVELGPYNTRDFTFWVRDMQIGQITTCGPVKSLRTGKHIQGWIFLPNWEFCSKLIKSTKLEFIAMIEDMNNDERLKGNTQSKLAADSKASAVLTRTLDAGWEDFPLTATEVRLSLGGG